MGSVDSVLDRKVLRLDEFVLSTIIFLLNNDVSVRPPTGVKFGEKASTPLPAMKASHRTNIAPNILF